MRRLSVVSSAALALTAHAAAHALGQGITIVTNSPRSDHSKQRVNDHGGGSAGIQFKAASDLNPISIHGTGDLSPISLHGGGAEAKQPGVNSKMYGIPDGVGTKPQWPNPGTSIGGAGQHERHTPAWMAAASRRPVTTAARA